MKTLATLVLIALLSNPIAAHAQADSGSSNNVVILGRLNDAYRSQIQTFERNVALWKRVDSNSLDYQEYVLRAEALKAHDAEVVAQLYRTTPESPDIDAIILEKSRIVSELARLNEHASITIRDTVQ